MRLCGPKGTTSPQAAAEVERTSLLRRLEEGARAQAERDLRLTQDWFPVAEDMYGDSPLPSAVPPKHPKRAPGA